jgi:two-component system sensor histidine kinase TctE
MSRLDRLLAHKRRFMRDASHQLRTPLAVLKVQVQSARRGDVAAATALAEIKGTVELATDLANQLLALAKVEQLHQQRDAPRLDWAEVVRGVALDLAPLVVEQGMEFELSTQAAPVRAHEWALRELVRNLLHKAIKHSQRAGRLASHVQVAGDQAVLTIADAGAGIDADLRQRLFQPFASGGNSAGAGLGLTICSAIVASLGGQLALDNRELRGQVVGLDATVRLTVPDNRG